MNDKTSDNGMVFGLKTPLLPSHAFDNERCRRRGPLDPDHAALRRVLDREFAGSFVKPVPSMLHGWFVADTRDPSETAWCLDLLLAASDDPWFGLRAMLSEDAFSVFDFARVCAESKCEHHPLTDWLNRYATQPPEVLAALAPPALGHRRTGYDATWLLRLRRMTTRPDSWTASRSSSSVRNTNLRDGATR